jgi:hypothetical protein
MFSVLSELFREPAVRPVRKERFLGEKAISDRRLFWRFQDKLFLHANAPMRAGSQVPSDVAMPLVLEAAWK